MDFEGRHYRGVFKAIKKLSGVLKKNRYHWDAFIEQCGEWHEAGMYVSEYLLTCHLLNFILSIRGLLEDIPKDDYT